MGKYKCKACGSVDTMVVGLGRLREQRCVYCNKCEANTSMVEYMKEQKWLGEFV